MVKFFLIFLLSHYVSLQALELIDYKSEADQIVNRLRDIYSPTFTERGLKLKISIDWADPSLGAYASQNGSNRFVKVYGGLATYELMTLDTLSLILCHELGHHIGGAPLLTDFFVGTMSLEGQADYWSTLKCFRQLYLSSNNEIFLTNPSVPSIAQKLCSKSFSQPEDITLCLRSSQAVEHLAIIVHTLEQNIDTNLEPHIETASTSEVQATNESYLTPQCMIDNLFQGALCPIPLNIKVSNKNPYEGACKDGEIGARPKCWFVNK